MSKPSILVIRLAAPALLAALVLGCGKAPAQPSRVIANIGGEKLTEADFQGVVRTLSQDPKEAETFLTEPAAREERARLASRIAMSRAIASYARLTGLDREPMVKARLEQEQANIFFQALMQKRLTSAEPTDEQLQAFYKERIALIQAQGGKQAIPPFEAVKAQVAEGWKAQRAQALSQEIQKEIKAKVPVTLADDYRPAGE